MVQMSKKNLFEFDKYSFDLYRIHSVSTLYGERINHYDELRLNNDSRISALFKLNRT